MKKCLLLIVSIIVHYNFCYGLSTAPKSEPYKIVSKNKKYFCWVDFNDNDTSKWEWQRKWILNVYNKDSVLLWERDYYYSTYAPYGMLANDGKKFIYVDDFEFAPPDYQVIKIIKQDSNDICFTVLDFNFDLLNYHYLKGNKLVLLLKSGKIWEIDIETGIMKMSVQNYFGLVLTASFLLLVFVAFVVVVVIRKVRNFNRKY